MHDTQMRDIFDLMRELRWTEQPAGTVTNFASHDRRYVVILIPHLTWWALGEYRAEDNYEFNHMADGATLEQLREALPQLPVDSLIEMTGQEECRTLALLARAGCTPEQAKAGMKLFAESPRGGLVSAQIGEEDDAIEW